MHQSLRWKSYKRTRPHKVLILSAKNKNLTLSSLGDHVPLIASNSCSWLTRFNAFLITIVVKTDNISYYRLPGSLNQSGHLPLTSPINKVFPPSEVLFAQCPTTMPQTK